MGLVALVVNGPFVIGAPVYLLVCSIATGSTYGIAMGLAGLCIAIAVVGYLVFTIPTARWLDKTCRRQPGSDQ